MGEMARQPDLVRAIKQEMEDPQFRVRVEWIEVEEFFERFASTDSKGKMGAGKDSGGSPSGDQPGKGGKGSSKGSKSNKPEPQPDPATKSSKHEGLAGGKGSNKKPEPQPDPATISSK